MKNILDIVRHYSSVINNGRTLDDIVDHLQGEGVELQEEIDRYEAGEEAGPDGILGEAIDVIACALDVIFYSNPHITDEQINQKMMEKCEKWARRYHNSVTGDRTID